MQLQEQIALLQTQLTETRAEHAASNAQLQQTREQSVRLAEALDKLRLESLQSVTELRNALVKADQGLQATKQSNFSPSKKSLVDLKSNEPKKFAGQDSEDVKVWAKAVRSWCNVKRRGFRVALEWAEIQPEALTTAEALAQIGSAFPDVTEADSELYELLTILCVGDALVLVERTKDRGFDAWRRLHARYNPKGGRFELDSMTKLLTRERCTSVAQIPAAVDKFEKEIAAYEIRSNNPFPPEWKTPILLKMLPKKEADELNMKFGLGENGLHQARHVPGRILQRDPRGRDPSKRSQRHGRRQHPQARRRRVHQRRVDRVDEQPLRSTDRAARRPRLAW